MINDGVSNITINATLIGLSFLYGQTLNRPHVLSKLVKMPIERKLPSILSQSEVARLSDAASHLKYRTAMLIAYGSGLYLGSLIT